TRCSPRRAATRRSPTSPAPSTSPPAPSATTCPRRCRSSARAHGPRRSGGQRSRAGCRRAGAGYSRRVERPEALLEQTDAGLVPKGEGWFVVNAREARWREGDFGAYTRFEGDARFPQLGINLSVLQPGQASCYYHGEPDQEDFLVLSGECL